MNTLSDDERESIVQEAFERILLHIPEVMGSLITNHRAQLEINKKFYGKYPEFKNHKDAVQSVVEMVEANNPNLEHEKLLEKAVPRIRKRIAEVSNLDTQNVTTKPDRTFEKIEPAQIDFKGHGEL